jgi:hypothetical protein
MGLNMTNTAQELLALKQRVDKAKTEEARLQGQLDQLQEQRRRDFGVSSDGEADLYLQELSAQAAALDEELADGVATIKEELGW